MRLKHHDSLEVISHFQEPKIRNKKVDRVNLKNQVGDLDGTAI